MNNLVLTPKYEAYQNSGLDWLGDIPKSWNLLANKHIFKLKKILVGKKSEEYELLSLTLKGIIKRDMDTLKASSPRSLIHIRKLK